MMIFNQSALSAQDASHQRAIPPNSATGRLPMRRHATAAVAAASSAGTVSAIETEPVGR